jgi:hypothetical protein
VSSVIAPQPPPVHLSVLLALGVSCGGTQSVHVNNEIAVDISITPKPDTLPFDPRSARLRMATDRLSAIVGHPVGFQFDAALLADYQSGFEDQLVVSIEATARGVTDWKKEEPDAFARSMQLLKRIECHYKVTAESPESKLEAGGALRIDEATHGSELVPEERVYVALREENDAYLDTTLVSKTPDDVKPAERRTYFAYLVRTRPGYGSLYERRFNEAQQKLDRVQKLAQSPHADVILKLLRLATLASSDPPLAKDVRAWLWEQLDYYGYRYNGDREELSQIGPGTPFRRAEAAYGAWLAVQLAKATDEETLFAARHFFSRDLTGCVRKACKADSPVFPGVDLFAVGLGIADEWARAGRPLEGGAGKHAELMDFVVCPYGKDTRGKRTRGLGCGAGWVLRSALLDPKRLADALDARGDPALADAVFANLRSESLELAIGLLNALDVHKPSWSAAVNVIAEEESSSSDVAPLASAIWRDHPDRRGAALYLLARTESYEEFWKGFSRSYGGAIGAFDLSGLLDQSPDGLRLVPQIWPALGQGFSRADLIVPRLDAWLPDASQPSAGPRVRVLSALVDRLCEDKNAVDLAKLNAWLARRASTRPGEEKALAILIRDSRSGGCAGRERSHPTEDDR